MDFPIFHLDGMGNRMLIAIIAILHVLINHGLAVGAMPMIAYLERKGMQTGDTRWDTLAYRLVFFCFVVTTTVGALTGVGIWFSVSLVNPYSIGSLLRIFFWGWFAEWIVFVVEVCLILAYTLTWKTWSKEKKKAHNRLGWFLALFSWITMALIVAVLAFMMNTGDWQHKPSFWSAFFNPLYFPQLAFRTSLAMVTAGLLAMCLIPIFVKREDGFRSVAMRAAAQWSLLWVPVLAIGSVWYWQSVPQAMTGNLAIALTTTEFATWHSRLMMSAIIAIAVVVGSCVYALRRPGHIRGWITGIPFVLTLLLLGYFERVREFIRKPFVIPGYMYSNTYRVNDYPLLQRDGVLPHATYTKHATITPATEVEAGRDVFLLTCSRCHTTAGVNGVRNKFQTMLGDQSWDKNVISTYIGAMHNARPFMPPFPGAKQELEALSAYIARLQTHPETSLGAQSTGIDLSPLPHNTTYIDP